MLNYIQRFWAWYNKHYKFHLRLSVFLFSWQIVHLIWMLIVVVLPKLFHYSRPELPSWFNLLLALVDYTEIPALIATSLLYLNDLRVKFSSKPILMLIFLNSQWLHLFWITDEFVLEAFAPAAAVVLPLWLAWLAILIDYLEVPVMYDTIKRWVKSGSLEEFS